MGALGYCKLSFAHPLRDMLRALGLTVAEMSEGKEQPHVLLCGKTPREALQTLGTEWGRNKIGENLWLGIAEHRARMALHTGPVAFDDVRFDNEARLIRSLGGIVIHVHRAGNFPIPGDHASERGISRSHIDYSISASEVSDLRTKLFTLLNEIPASGTPNSTPHAERAAAA